MTQSLRSVRKVGHRCEAQGARCEARGPGWGQASVVVRAAGRSVSVCACEPRNSTFRPRETREL